MTMQTTDNFSAEVAEEIRAVMGRRRISQAELARRLGTNDVWIGVRLRGRQAIDLNDLWRIAEALDIRILDLMPRRLNETKPYRAVAAPTAPILPIPGTPVPHRVAPTRPPDRRPPGRSSSPSRPPSPVRTARVY